MNSKKEKLLKEAYSKLLEVGFGDGPLETINQFIDDDVMGYGTAQDEKIMSIQEFSDLMIDQRKQAVNFDDFSFTSKPVINRISGNGNTAVIVDEIVLLTRIQGEANELAVRMSTVFEFRDGYWKLIHWHGSKPEHISGGDDPWHVNEWKRKNEELQKLVDEKTSELLNKNRELEIETSLEKVRTIAMGMRKPDDMLDVCKTISLQLNSLGVKDIRNVQTAIIYASKSIYINYEYYAKHKKQLITVVDFKSHYYQKLFVNKMLKGTGEIFTKTLKGKKVKEWYEYQKTTNQFADRYLIKAKSLSYYWFSLGPLALGISTYSPLSEEQLNLFIRFRNVFELAYQRYLDIEKAEGQAREAKIEASLEKVRAVAMSMHNSEDLLNVCEVLYKEFCSLGFDGLRNAMINIHNDEKKSFVNYDYSDEIGRSINQLVYDIHPLVEKQIKKIRSADDAFSETYFTGKDLVNWRKFRKRIGEKDDPRLHQTKGLFYYFYSIGIGSIGISTFGAIDEDQKALLKRFRNVFALSYQRYMDISKAEAQAKEAQIETSLERMRTTAMSMQKPEDLLNISRVFFKELIALGFRNIRCALIHIFNDEKGYYYDYDYSDFTGGKITHIPYTGHKSMEALLKKIRKSEDAFVEFISKGTDLKKWIQFRKESDQIVDERLNTAKQLNYYFYSIGAGNIGISTFGNIEAKQIEILKRFRNVFKLSYQRYVDIEKAEAQAREAQIEAALEKVRSRSLAMHKSDEIKDVVLTVMEKMNELKIEMNGGVSLATFIEGSQDLLHWYVNPAHVDGPVAMHLTYFDNLLFKDFIEARKSGKEILSVVYSFEEKNRYFEYAFEHSDFRIIPEELKQWILEQPYFGYSVAIQKHSAIFFNDYTGKLFSEKENEVLIRFAKVFDQAYIRFLDLQKAEAQAREAQIEAALERVRSRTMGMQKSEELKEVIQLVYEQFVHLNIHVEHTGFILDYKTRDDMYIWLADKHEVPSQITIPYFDSPHWNSFIEAKAKGKDFFANHLDFEEKNKFYKDLFKLFPVPDKAKEYYFSCPGLAISTVLLDNVSLYIENFSGTPYSNEENSVLMRFGKVFQQTYTRFLDLKKAESQAREAQIEAALERLRAKAMAMHHSDELDEMLAILCEQFDILGIIPMSAHMTVLDIEHNKFTFRETGKFGNRSFGEQTIALDAMDTWKDMVESWKNVEPYSINSLHFPKETLPQLWEVFHESFSSMPEGSRIVPEDYPDGIYHTAGKHPYGYIGMNQTRKATKEEEQIVIKFANEFGRAYQRFLDLQKAEAQNKIIQADNDRKTKELEDARQLQLSMLPKELPQLPHLDIAVYMKTATEVGGDYYDFNIDDNGTLTVLVGDATGHGMMSGMMVSIMKSFFISNRRSLDLKQFFENANNSLKEMHLGRLMMTLIGVQINSEKLIATNAGMPSLLYFRNKSQKTGEFVSHNFPLGAMKGTKYLLKEINYEIGDTLLLMSDGFAELKNEKNEQYGYERVKKEFMSVAQKSPNEIVEHLKSSASQWIKGIEPDDDVTFVVIKVK